MKRWLNTGRSRLASSVVLANLILGSVILGLAALVVVGSQARIWLERPHGDLEKPEVRQPERAKIEAPRLDPDVLELALAAHSAANARGLIDRPELLTVIDYSLPSTSPRLWVLDLENSKVLYEELVAHGRGTGMNRATEFSNRPGSKQSSLGLFSTASTYHGGNGYSLNLEGLEQGVNHQAYDRRIVIHGARYVSEEFAKKNGRLGRSWGCPALRKSISREIIDQIKGGSAVFAYYPDETWLASSEFLAGVKGKLRRASMLPTEAPQGSDQPAQGEPRQSFGRPG